MLGVASSACAADDCALSRSAMSQDPELPKPTLKERFERLMARYGRVVLPVYFGIFALTLLGFALAIQAGFEVDSAAAGAGTWAAAYVATKVTQPLRIAATLLLTPLVANVISKLRRTSEPPA